MPPLPALTVRLSSGGSVACYQVRWRGDRPEAVTLRIPGNERRKLTLLQLAYDPARRTRYLFYASTNSATRNPAGGARQEWKLYSYVPLDGESIALVLQMSADWTDPRDGRVYRYFQFASGDFVPLAKEGSTAFRLDSGPAVPRPIEVRVFAEDDWAGCASRAAVPKAAGVSSPNR